MDVSLSDLDTVMRVAQKVDANPVVLAGRLVGFSGPEQRAGLPGWALALILLGGGAAAALYLAPRVREFAENGHRWLSKGGEEPNGKRSVFGRWE